MDMHGNAHMCARVQALLVCMCVCAQLCRDATALNHLRNDNRLENLNLVQPPAYRTVLPRCSRCTIQAAAAPPAGATHRTVAWCSASAAVC